MVIERIDYEKCNGCGECVKSCPMDVIRIDQKTGKAIIKYPEECMCCAACENDCPTEAIYVSPEKLEQPLLSWC
ncbi:MAG: 4Fe-4S binding protein [Candidatus Bathyarchaeia archaeon]